MLLRDAKRKKRPIYPDSWDNLSQGSRVREELELALAPIIERVFGYYLVKLGGLTNELNLKSCPIKEKVNFALNPTTDAHIVGRSCQLPFQNNSVDAFVVLAELDFAQDPHQIIREIDRAITSDGQVIIAGFNPFSLAGIFKYLPINRRNLLHQGRFFTSARIKDWLQLLDFDVVKQEQIVYSSLFTRVSFGKNRPFFSKLDQKLNGFCKRYLPWFSSMYILVAKKREVPLSPIKKQWQINPKFKPRPATVALNHQSKQNEDSLT
ncbi:class I SAM-dependent methyltransferase [Glaciecola sp. 1036]|uniref:class I SAM-dependent methyltransferase n=1 Tax=Alteromonadaceae TaxID=72275 RepID=UPI003CFEA56A